MPQGWGGVVAELCDALAVACDQLVYPCTLYLLSCSHTRMVYSHTRIVTMQVGEHERQSLAVLTLLSYLRNESGGLGLHPHPNPSSNPSPNPSPNPNPNPNPNQADWAYILGKCAPALRATHAEGRAPLDGGAKTARAQLDAFTRGVFDRFRTGAGGDAGGPLCQEVEQP